MKKIIQGKRYDTDSATLIEKHWNGYSCSDFKHCTEWLYRTKNGSFFLHGEGGALSRYSESYGDMSGGGEDIIPLSKEEALEWLEQHDFADAIEEHFPDAIQDA